MSDDGLAVVPREEGPRRAFLGAVEAALAARGIPGLALTYRLEGAGGQAPGVTVLVASLSDGRGEVRVGAVTAQRVRVTTSARGVWEMEEGILAGLRAQARALGIAAVAGTQRVSVPFPVDGVPEYEAEIYEPEEDSAGEEGLVDQRHMAKPEEVAELVGEWAAVQGRCFPPGPRSAASMRSLRALASARKEAVAGIDWVRVEGLRTAGDLGRAWDVAGVLSGFDPAAPETGIEGLEGGAAGGSGRPAPEAGSLVEQVARRLARSGLEAIVDPSVVAGKIERMVAALAMRPAPVAGASEGRAAPDPALTREAAEALREDLAALSPRRLLWHLPRDERGRLRLGERVLLASYDTTESVGQGKRVWLVAALPARRGETQAPTLRLMPLIGANYTHRWDEARWRWDERSAGRRTAHPAGQPDTLPIGGCELPDLWEAEGSG
jgi:hypothetical protein